MDPRMWKKKPNTGMEPVRDRLLEVRLQLQEGLRKMQHINSMRLRTERNQQAQVEMEEPPRHVETHNTSNQSEA